MGSGDMGGGDMGGGAMSGVAMGGGHMGGGPISRSGPSFEGGMVGTTVRGIGVVMQHIRLTVI